MVWARDTSSLPHNCYGRCDTQISLRTKALVPPVVSNVGCQELPAPGTALDWRKPLNPRLYFLPGCSPHSVASWYEGYNDQLPCFEVAEQFWRAIPAPKFPSVEATIVHLLQFNSPLCTNLLTSFMDCSQIISQKNLLEANLGLFLGNLTKATQLASLSQVLTALWLVGLCTLLLR